jgi:hypothetical protein
MKNGNINRPTRTKMKVTLTDIVELVLFERNPKKQIDHKLGIK